MIGTVDLLSPTFGSTTFDLSDPDSFGNNSVGGRVGDFAGFGIGIDIDDAAVNFHSLTLAVVPEPSSAILLACMGIVAIRTRRR